MSRQWDPDCKGPCDCPGEEVEDELRTLLAEHDRLMTRREVLRKLREMLGG